MKKSCKIKTITVIVAVLLSTHSYAGFNGFTIHSRANCGNNESISWDWTHDWWLWTTSKHIKNRSEHTVDTGKAWTWRSAAVHWGEGTGDYTVSGNHYRHYTDNTYHNEGNTIVNNCDIYDGWWDKNK